MRPVLFQIYGMTVPSFFFMVMVAAIAATFAAVRFARKEGLSEVVILDMSIIAVVGSMIGARVFFIIVENPGYFLEDWRRVFYFWQGGYVSLGAFIFSIAGWVIYLRMRRLDVARYIDIGALIAPIIKFFVRLGCFLTGCCYGRPTASFAGIVFRPGSPAYDAYHSTPVHPTQIYNMINAVIMFAVLYIVYKRRRFYGQVGAVFLMYYGATRFIIEFFRTTVERKTFFGDTLTAGHIVMVVTFFAGVIMYLIMERRREDSHG